MDEQIFNDLNQSSPLNLFQELESASHKTTVETPKHTPPSPILTSTAIKPRNNRSGITLNKIRDTRAPESVIIEFEGSFVDTPNTGHSKKSPLERAIHKKNMAKFLKTQSEDDMFKRLTENVSFDSNVSLFDASLPEQVINPEDDSFLNLEKSVQKNNPEDIFKRPALPAVPAQGLPMHFLQPTDNQESFMSAMTDTTSDGDPNFSWGKLLNNKAQNISEIDYQGPVLDKDFSLLNKPEASFCTGQFSARSTSFGGSNEGNKSGNRDADFNDFSGFPSSQNLQGNFSAATACSNIVFNPFDNETSQNLQDFGSETFGSQNAKALIDDAEKEFEDNNNLSIATNEYKSNSDTSYSSFSSSGISFKPPNGDVLSRSQYFIQNTSCLGFLDEDSSNKQDFLRPNLGFQQIKSPKKLSEESLPENATNVKASSTFTISKEDTNKPLENNLDDYKEIESIKKRLSTHVGMEEKTIQALVSNLTSTHDSDLYTQAINSIKDKINQLYNKKSSPMELPSFLEETIIDLEKSSLNNERKNPEPSMIENKIAEKSYHSAPNTVIQQNFQPTKLALEKSHHVLSSKSPGRHNNHPIITEKSSNLSPNTVIQQTSQSTKPGLRKSHQTVSSKNLANDNNKPSMSKTKSASSSNLANLNNKKPSSTMNRRSRIPRLIKESQPEITTKPDKKRSIKGQRFSSPIKESPVKSIDKSTIKPSVKKDLFSNVKENKSVQFPSPDVAALPRNPLATKSSNVIENLKPNVQCSPKFPLAGDKKSLSWLAVEAGKSESQTLLLNNPTSELIEFNAIIRDSNDFQLSMGNTQQFQVQPNSAAEVKVTFTPSSNHGYIQGKLVLKPKGFHGLSGKPIKASIPLQGLAGAPILEIENIGDLTHGKRTINFGRIERNCNPLKQMIIFNEGHAPAFFKLQGFHDTECRIPDDDFLNIQPKYGVIKENQSCTITIQVNMDRSEVKSKKIHLGTVALFYGPEVTRQVMCKARLLPKAVRLSTSNALLSVDFTHSFTNEEMNLFKGNIITDDVNHFYEKTYKETIELLGYHQTEVNFVEFNVEDTLSESRVNCTMASINQAHY